MSVVSWFNCQSLVSSPVITRIQPALDFWVIFVLLYLAPKKQHKIIVNGVGLECENVLEIWGEILGKCISKNWEGFVVISRSLGWPTPENLTRHFLTLSWLGYLPSFVGLAAQDSYESYNIINCYFFHEIKTCIRLVTLNNRWRQEENAYWKDFLDKEEVFLEVGRKIFFGGW